MAWTMPNANVFGSGRRGFFAGLLIPSVYIAGREVGESDSTPARWILNTLAGHYPIGKDRGTGTVGPVFGSPVGGGGVVAGGVGEGGVCGDVGSPQRDPPPEAYWIDRCRKTTGERRQKATIAVSA